MKLKTIFLISTAVGILFSCVSEDVIPPTPGKGEDITLDLKLKLGDMITTRATGDNGYKHATADELKVSKAVVAVFRLSDAGVPGDLVTGITTVTGPTETTVSASNDTLAYIIPGVKVKTGKIRVLAIANSAYTGYADCEDYSDFQAVIEETQFTANFDPKTLVKAGYIDLDIQPTDTPQPIVVPMIQLAARVDLRLMNQMPRTVEPGEVDFSPELEGALKEFGKSVKDYTETNKLTVGDYRGWECKGKLNEHLWSKGYTTYVNPVTGDTKTINQKGKFAEVESVSGSFTIDSVYTITQWAVNISDITINNIQTKSPVLLESFYDAQNTQPLAAANWTISLDSLVKDNFDLTFYTYEKKAFDTDTDPDVLSISLNTSLIKGTSTLRKTFTVKSIHGLWADANGNQLGGWASDKPDSKDIFVPIANEITASGPVVDEFEQEEGSQPFAKSFTIPINPKQESPDYGDPTKCHTNGVVRGNLYALDAIFKSTVQETELEYSVVSWGIEAKNIAPFE